MPPGRQHLIRQDIIELAAAYVEYSVFVTTAELEFPGPQILYVNSAFTRMTGYSVSEMLGKTPRVLQGPRSDRQVLNRLREALSSGHDFIARAVNYRRDGTPFELEWIITHLKDSEGRTTHYIAMQRDITGQRRAQDELAAYDNELRAAAVQFSETMRRLEQAEERLIEREKLTALGEMTAGVVHDISNALSPVFNLIQMLNIVDDLSQEARTYVSHLELSARHAMQVLSNLKLHYRNAEASIVKASSNLRTILEQMPALTKSRWWPGNADDGKHISFALDLQDVPEIVVNETQMVQVFVNLIYNAIDAMPDGGTITMQLRWENDQLMIRICDTGPGLSQDMLDRCFEPYVTTRAAGSGLGLSVCRRIVEDHGGRIDVTSPSSGGTEFTVLLPLSEVPVCGARCSVPRRILHIDNNVTREDLLSRTIRSLGHQVDVVRTGDEGLQRFFDDPYDLVIAGSGLHPTSGIDVAQAIKRKSPEVPFAISLEASETLDHDSLPVFLQLDAVIKTSEGPGVLQKTLHLLGLTNTMSSPGDAG